MMDLYLSSDSGVDYTLFSESTLIFLLESDTTVQKSIFDKLKQQISTMIEKELNVFESFCKEMSSDVLSSVNSIYQRLSDAATDYNDAARSESYT